MKQSFKIFTFLALTIFTACTNEETKPLIDVEKEFSSQPEMKISWVEEDGTAKETVGASGSFCSDIMCFDQGIPNSASFSYSEYKGQTPITLTIKTAKDISITSIFVTLRDADFKTVQTLSGEGTEPETQSITDDSNQSNIHTYKMEKPFKETGNLIFHVKIKWDGGYATSYFPLLVE